MVQKFTESIVNIEKAETYNKTENKKIITKIRFKILI